MKILLRKFRKKDPEKGKPLIAAGATRLNDIIVVMAGTIHRIMAVAKTIDLIFYQQSERDN